MEYNVKFFYTDNDITEVIDEFKDNVKISITYEQAIKIIRICLKSFGDSWLWDKDIKHTYKIEEIQNIIKQ